MKHFYLYYFVLLLGLCPFVSCTKNEGNSEVTLDKQSVVKAPNLKVEFKAALNEVKALQTTKQEEIKTQLKKARVSDKNIELALNEFKQTLAKTEKALDDIADLLVKKYGEDKQFKDLPKQEVDALVKEYVQTQLRSLASTAQVSSKGSGKNPAQTSAYLSEGECKELLKDTKGASEIGLYLLCRFSPGRN